MKVHCLFEQTNTFRDAARRLGFAAESCDLPGTAADRGCDLIAEIEAFSPKPGVFALHPVFGGVAQGDLVVAFFPCTYFANTLANQGVYAGAPRVLRRPNGAPRPQEELFARRAAALRYRAAFLKLREIARVLGWRLVIENPASSMAKPGAISDIAPDFIIRNRSLWGDSFHKPTAFYSENVAWPLMLPPADIGSFRAVQNAKAALLAKLSARKAKGEERKARAASASFGAQRGGFKCSSLMEAVPRSGYFKPDGSRHQHTSLLDEAGRNALRGYSASNSIVFNNSRRSLERSRIAPAFAETFLKWLLPANNP
jgi:hypothetical protein